MILHPGIIALLVSSGLITALALYASWYGAAILRSWDMASGSSRQLELERRTYLISTILSYVFGFQLLSLFLFVYTADSLCPLFVGAMCAAGTLNANSYGYPVLVLKIVNFLLAGLWLILNTADNQAEDYPLIRKKYALLLVIAPLLLIETVLQVLYAHGLNPNVITSCCGTLFSASSRGVAADLASLPAAPLEAAFTISLLLSIAAGTWFALRRKGGYVVAALAGLTFVIGVLSLISFIGPYAYELPSHHCPFCVLQPEYHRVGYLLYAGLLGGAVSGLGVGILMPFRRVKSLVNIVPAMQRSLVVSMLFFDLFLGITTLVIVLTSNLRM
jgi:hypothetical protein